MLRWNVPAVGVYQGIKLSPVRQQSAAYFVVI
jgi:hypothetical protein